MTNPNDPLEFPDQTPETPNLPVEYEAGELTVTYRGVPIAQFSAEDDTTLEDNPLHVAGRLALKVYGLGIELQASLEREKRLEELTMTDPLTGIGNRRYLDTEYRRMTTSHPQRRSHESTPVVEEEISAIMLDIDHFGNLNNTHGHAVGDLVLEDVGRRLRGGVRARDALGRYGGEEFVAMFPRTDLEEVTQIAENIRTDIEGAEFGTPPLRITVSIGVGRLLQAESLAAGLAEADAAMYEAKRAGRNMVVRADQLPQIES